ncbi:MAG: DUF4912 domain-containing protein [Candidatus Omnitrophica bacterium]|nr:DUF4912 domain-containing protein [Candidatus Omnitrophota bacterium]
MAKKTSVKKIIKARKTDKANAETGENKALKIKEVKAAKPARKKLGKGLEDISTLFLSDIKKDSAAAKKKTQKPLVAKKPEPKLKKNKTTVVKKMIKAPITKITESARVKDFKKTVADLGEKTIVEKKIISKKTVAKVVKKIITDNKDAAKKTMAKAIKKTALLKKQVSEKAMAEVVKKAVVVKENVPKKTVAEIAKKVTVVKESIPAKVIVKADLELELHKDINSPKTTVLNDKNPEKGAMEKKIENIAEEKLKAKKATSKPNMKKTEVVRMGTLKKSSKEDTKPTQVKTTAKKNNKINAVSKKTQNLGPISELKTLLKKKTKAEQTADSLSIQAEQVIEDSKFFVSKETVSRITEDEFFELPEGYGDNRIVIQVRDPYWLFAYWEISQRKLNSVVGKYGNYLNRARRVLRVYDITAVSFNGNNANSFFDIDVNDIAKNWYVNVGNPGRSYCIDIGLILENGSFVVLARSNFVTTPIDAPSMVTDEEWMIVEEDFNKLYGLSAGLGIGLSSGELRKQIKTRLRNLSSGILSSPGITTVKPSRNFWMVVNTELIVYGATQPGSELTVQGKPIVLNEDGTFSLRFALPDGEQIIPVRAVSPDKVEERVITPVVTKNTV